MIFFYPLGARFTKATHYLPLNGTTAAKKLLDLRGNASGVPENGVKQSIADQIGYVLTLDGTDDFIELKNIKDQCVVDPSLCREGLSVAFWMKYNTGDHDLSWSTMLISQRSLMTWLLKICAGKFSCQVRIQTFKESEVKSAQFKYIQREMAFMARLSPSSNWSQCIK